MRSQNHTYTWYSMDQRSNGGNEGSASGGNCSVAGHCDTEKFVVDVNSQALCGRTIWRMPTRKELTSILDRSRTNPALDTNYFPNTPTPASGFWSGSADATFAFFAWSVDFSTGRAESVGKGSPNQVRLVSGP